MGVLNQSVVAEHAPPRARGLAVVASKGDAAAASHRLPHRGVDWTVLTLFARQDGGGDRDASSLAGGLEDVGWRSRYRGVTPAIRDALDRADRLCGPFDRFATHAPADIDAHPAIWHIANVVAERCGDRPLDTLAFRRLPAKSIPDSNPKDFLHLSINGQIVQRPKDDSPGIMVSPFWTIPWELRGAARTALMRHGRPDRWYVVMADTTYGNLPPSYVLPFVGGRFSVDPQERRHLRERFPDLDLLEFCQSQLTPEDIYAPMPRIAKEFDLVYSARICEVKRHHLLLDALVALERAGRRLRTLLLFYPKDNEDTRVTTRAVRERIAADKLDVTFHTTGKRGNNEHEVAAMLNRCRAGVFLSAEEGPAFAIPEYLLCDLPVVADAGLRGGGLYFLNDRNARFFHDPASLQRALLDVLDRRGAFEPRSSALDQAIGEHAGNMRFATVLAAHGIVLRTDAEPLRRHLAQIELAELCK